VRSRIYLDLVILDGAEGVLARPVLAVVDDQRGATALLPRYLLRDLAHQRHALGAHLANTAHDVSYYEEGGEQLRRGANLDAVADLRAVHVVIIIVLSVASVSEADGLGGGLLLRFRVHTHLVLARTKRLVAHTHTHCVTIAVSASTVLTCRKSAVEA
jgi:hypothetical protein